MNALLDPGIGLHGNREKLQLVAELISGFEIGGRDRRDAFDIDSIGVDLCAEGNRSEDRQLVGAVEAFDVKGSPGDSAHPQAVT